MPRLKREIHVHGWFLLERTCYGMRIRRCLSCGAVQSRQHGAWITLSLPFPSPNTIETR
jgi:hypothetical protein